MPAKKIRIRRRRSFISVLVFLILCSFKLPANADSIYLKNGRKVEGIIKREDGQGVTLEVDSGVMRFPKNQIRLVRYSVAENTQIIKRRQARERAGSEAGLKGIRQQDLKQVILNQQNENVVVEATLNKRVKVDLVLDTGSSLVILSNRVANSLGIDVSIKTYEGGDLVELVLPDGRTVKARRIFLDSVEVQGSEARNGEAAVFPAQEDKGFLRRDGLLGMSFLKNFDFKIDQANNSLILEKLQ
jgi:clan AA aspartic protease (TIGR02281 family)